MSRVMASLPRECYDNMGIIKKSANSEGGQQEIKVNFQKIFVKNLRTDHFVFAC